jgi:hypothetical protein
MNLKESEMSHNLGLYKSFLERSGVMNIHDQKLLSNKLSGVFQDLDCSDNYRVCVSDVNKFKSEEYTTIKNRGCCGEYDEFVYNPVTGNYFWIGCNYGH